MDSECQNSPSDGEDDGADSSSRPISPRYSGTRRVSFAASLPGTLPEDTELEDVDDGVTVQDLREQVGCYLPCTNVYFGGFFLT